MSNLTGTDVNKLTGITNGTAIASKCIVLDANKGQDVITLKNAASAAATIESNYSAIVPVDDGSTVELKVTFDDNGTEISKFILDETTGWKALAQGVQWDASNSSPVLTRLGSFVGLAASASPGNDYLPIQSDMKRCVMNDNGTVNYYLDADSSYMKQYTTVKTSGTADGTTESKLVDSGADFVTDAVAAGMWVHNTTDDTWTMITAVDDLNTLSVLNDIFISGENYVIGTAILNGDDGQVMVEIPKFYVKYSRTADVLKWYVSKYHLTGFEIHPAFLKDGVEVDYRYIGAFEAVPYDDGASAYNDGAGAAASNFNGGAVDLANDKIGSVAGYKSLTDETIVEFRTLAGNIGSGWQQLDVFLIGAVQLLYLIEYADFNSQVEIGTGNTSYDAWDFSNNVGYNGYSIPDGNATAASNTAEDALGITDVNDGITNREYMSYRGIENLYGSVWNWYDGLNMYSNKAYVCYKSSNYESYANAGAESLVKNHELIGTLANASGYVQDIYDYGFGFFADDVSGGSASTYITDYYYQAAGWRVAALGGYASHGVKAGVFHLHVDSTLAHGVSTIGGRLAY